MKKMLLLFVSGLLIACMAGSAMADPFDAALWNAAGTAPADTTLNLKPGESITLSFHLSHVAYPNSKYNYDVPVISAAGGGSASDIIVSPSPLGSFVPSSLQQNIESDGTGYTDVGAITITLASNAPLGASYSVKIGAASESTQVVIDSGSASRNVNSIPEFPTVALPVAAVIGLVFVLGRKKEGL